MKLRIPSVLGTAGLVLALLSFPAHITTAAPQAPPPLRPRVAAVKPARTTLRKGEHIDQVIVKFQEGSHIRLKGGRLTIDAASLTTDEKGRLARTGLAPTAVQRDLAAANNLLTQKQRSFRRLFTPPEQEMEARKQRGEQTSKKELADLNLYYFVKIAGATPAGTAQLIDQLNALPSVEIAYAQPIDYSADIAPATPDFSGSQGYLDAAPNGIDARYAWTIPGGRGSGVRVVDVELAWQLDHEDLPATFYMGGTQATDQASRNHGVAVLGEIAALDDGHGVTGIAPQTAIGVTSNNNLGSAAAIIDAAWRILGGDIILVEDHRQGPSSGNVCNDGNCSQWEYIPVEYWQAEFDAIESVTSQGMIVVEAAGNGGMDLDSSIYEQRFDRGFRDSGAIIVGAGISSTRAPQAWSDAGSRVDVQGWGDSVMTLGYGDQTVAGATMDVRQWYTTSFAGTSSASPIVVGAVAAIQGVRHARGLPVMDATSMRRLLRLSGTPQADSTRQIGPLPNLRAAIIGIADRYAESGGACNDASNEGWLHQPFCTFQRAIDRTPDGGTLGIVGGSVYGPRTFSRRMTITSVGGAVIIGR